MNVKIFLTPARLVKIAAFEGLGTGSTAESQRASAVCALLRYKGGPNPPRAASHWRGSNGGFSGHQFRLQLVRHLRTSTELARQNQSDTASGGGANCTRSPDHQ